MRAFALFFLTILCGVAAFGQSKSELKLIDEIKKMDRQWIIEAYSTKDLSDFDRTVADDFMITGANGKMLNKSEKRASGAADYTETW